MTSSDPHAQSGHPSVRPLVRYESDAAPLECPFGHVTRIVTGGDGGIANVHRVRVTKGSEHFHVGYDEVYYVLGGRGRITLGADSWPIKPGAVVVVPRGTRHSLEADDGETLDFVIFGTPSMSVEDDRFRPHRPEPASAPVGGGSSAPDSSPR